MINISITNFVSCICIMNFVLRHELCLRQCVSRRTNCVTELLNVYLQQYEESQDKCEKYLPTASRQVDLFVSGVIEKMKFPIVSI